MGERKSIHFTVPKELYEDFHRLFPKRGEKTAFLSRIVKLVVEKAEEGETARRVIDSFLEEEG
jgi:hypothetical protein